MVIQSDAFNRSRINTVIVAIITSNLKFEAAPGNIRLLKGESGIPKASVVNMSQLRTLDRSFIEAKIGTLSRERLVEVRAGLRIVLDL